MTLERSHQLSHRVITLHSMFRLHHTMAIAGRLVTLSLRCSASRSEALSSTSAQQISSCHILLWMGTIIARQVSLIARLLFFPRRTIRKYSHAIINVQKAGIADRFRVVFGDVFLYSVVAVFDVGASMMRFAPHNY